nr:transporter substrate-binding domain-containing protein [Vallitaleaceae bacterium]
QFYYASVTDYAPIEYMNDSGEIKGFGIQYLEYASELLGIEFIPYNGMTDMTWSEKLLALETGTIDLLTTVSLTEDRLEYIHFTDPYLVANIIVVGNDDERLILDEASMADGLIALPSHYWQNSYITSIIPEAKIINTDTIMDSFNLIDRKIADFTFLESTVYNYYTQQHHYSNLKIVGELDLQISHHIGVTYSKPLLRDILNKIIQNTSSSVIQSDAIIIEKPVDHQLFLLYIIIFISFLLLTIIIYLIRALNKRNRNQKQLEKSKIQLIEQLSHDLKTPLTSLKVNVDLLSYNIITENDKQDHYHKIDNQVMRLNSIIDELYLISNKDAPYELSQPQNQIIPISQILSNYYYEELAYVESNNRLLSFDDLTNGMAHIKIDTSDLFRILTNLITNAVNFTAKKGKILLKLTQDDTDIIISIVDNGIGVSQEYLPHIFEQFYQISSSKNTDGKGLGLFITKELILQNGGTISVTSDVNSYTEFNIRFPMQ